MSRQATNVVRHPQFLLPSWDCAAPPFSIRDGNGEQLGYDGRYADPRGRTAYLKLALRY